eukprot:208276-Pleurochrysis_carterae.AAC.4
MRFPSGSRRHPRSDEVQVDHSTARADSQPNSSARSVAPSDSRDDSDCPSSISLPGLRSLLSEVPQACPVSSGREGDRPPCAACSGLLSGQLGHAAALLRRDAVSEQEGQGALSSQNHCGSFVQRANHSRVSRL